MLPDKVDEYLSLTSSMHDHALIIDMVAVSSLQGVVPLVTKGHIHGNT